MKTINNFLSSLLFVGAISGLLWTTSAARGGVAITNLHSFSAFPDGAYPQSALVQGKDGDFYGTAPGGGLGGGNGTVFKITPKGVLTTLYSFTGLNDGSNPNGLVLEADGSFYGTTESGGTNSAGTFFKMTARGMLTTLYSFGYGNGEYPLGALVKGSDGDFYGTTSYGGANYKGTVFKITSGGVLTTLYSFMGTNDGASPYAGLVQGKDGSFYGTARIGGDYSTGTSGYGTVFKITRDGTFTSLYSFSGGSDGANPQAALAQGKDGSFYGTTISGGQEGVGTVFNVTADGTFTGLYSFTYTSGGWYPQAGLIQGSKGDFYGTTYSGGSNGSGTVFHITTAGALTTLHSFTGGNGGAYPEATLALGSDGNFYGTTSRGGTNSIGTVFKITPNGILTSLFSFPGLNDGNSPNSLVLGADGSFYGTATGGGTNNDGVVFKITTNGMFTSLHSFDGSDGDSPNGLALGSDGAYYGTTPDGGSNGYGTVFQITSNGVLTTLYSFDGGDAGGAPWAALVKGSNGNFYGTTSSGGSNDDGTVFQITPNGTLTSLYSFTNGSDGSDPQAALALGMDGNLYGITLAGGAYGHGGVFRISTQWQFTNPMPLAF